MRKLMLIPIVAVMLGAASPAAAIHDPPSGTFVPAGDCANADSEAVGHPAASVLNGTPAGPLPNPGGSDFGLTHNDASPNCAAVRP
ncbi:MAG TPA: hypothetical protein VFZ41_04390 [Solirubrobacterales bacterium]